MKAPCSPATVLILGIPLLHFPLPHNCLLPLLNSGKMWEIEPQTELQIINSIRIRGFQFSLLIPFNPSLFVLILVYANFTKNLKRRKTEFHHTSKTRDRIEKFCISALNYRFLLQELRMGILGSKLICSNRPHKFHWAFLFHLCKVPHTPQTFWIQARKIPI